MVNSSPGSLCAPVPLHSRSWPRCRWPPPLPQGALPQTPACTHSHHGTPVSCPRAWRPARPHSSPPARWQRTPATVSSRTAGELGGDKYTAAADTPAGRRTRAESNSPCNRTGHSQCTLRRGPPASTAGGGTLAAEPGHSHKRRPRRLAAKGDTDRRCTWEGSRWPAVVRSMPAAAPAADSSTPEVPPVGCPWAGAGARRQCRSEKLAAPPQEARARAQSAESGGAGREKV